jgi:hypothetical protein
VGRTPRSLLVALAVALCSAAPAPAATTIGSTSGLPDDNMPCIGLCTYFTESATLAVPSDGVLVSWRLNSGSDSVGVPVVALRAIRPVGGGSYSGVGTSTTEVITVGVNGPFATRIPVTAGDLLAINNDSQGLYFDQTVGGPTGRFFTGGLADGASGSPDGSAALKRLLVEADLEADIDGDGFGDETQDQCPRASTDQTLPCDPDTIGGGGGGGGGAGGGGGPPGIPPGPSGSLPPPVTGTAVNADTVSGTVLVKVPGSNRFVVLGTQERQIPTGSTIDTRKGRVSIVTAVGTASKKTQQAVFFDGVFLLTQPKAARDAVVEAKLVGKLENCPKRGRAVEAARRGRRLWGSGKGRFRTRGRRSSTTVRGTTWLVEDRCDGSTLNRVTQGKVVVRDFGLRKDFNLKAPATYIARP